MEKMKILALERKVNSLKRDLDGSKHIIRQLNRELGDAQDTIEYYGILLEEQYQKLQKYKEKYGEL